MGVETFVRLYERALSRSPAAITGVVAGSLDTQVDFLLVFSGWRHESRFFLENASNRLGFLGDGIAGASKIRFDVT